MKILTGRLQNHKAALGQDFIFLLTADHKMNTELKLKGFR